MAKPLIIVESPAKTKTLKNFLGDRYQIEASMGHVRDLPRSRLGVNIAQDFAPEYRPIAERKQVLKHLQEAAKKADTVYLASDPDREGEAIAWHLAETLKLKNPRRIQFNEITQQAVQQALQNPRDINMDLVNAQQARRILDRLIGYKLSPLLSKKIQSGLSAGRVQSVALRLICEREREIQAFVPEEYWSLTAILTPEPPEVPFLFAAQLHSRGGERVELKTEADVNAVLAEIEGARYRVVELKKRDVRRNPPPPFITSTLQQEAARKLYFSNRQTMAVAQELYEGVELGPEGSVGLITYMRTDSVRVAQEAQEEARRFILERYGEAYVPPAPRQYKTRREAQDAHEAIRPTRVDRLPEQVAPYLTEDQLKLYRLIWQRFVASQMSPAQIEVTTADIAAQVEGAEKPPYIFRATGSVMKFDGFTRVYTEGKDTEEKSDEERPPLPPLHEQQPLALERLEPRQHFTEPPPRYNEATIVKALEEKGIGRPSTYATIISVLRDRNYVELVNRSFVPTELGFLVNDQLVKHFPDIVDVGFTADMETHLDEIEEGKADWVALLREFYGPFEQSVAQALEKMESHKPPPVETEYRCPKTGNVMLLRQSRYGVFLGCSAYPKCKKILKLNEKGEPVEGPEFTCGLEETKPAGAAVGDPSTLPNATELRCPDGREAVMVRRQGPFGPFLGCSAYPKCRTVLKLGEDGLPLPCQEFKCTYSEKGARKARTTPKSRTTKKKG